MTFFKSLDMFWTDFPRRCSFVHASPGKKMISPMSKVKKWNRIKLILSGHWNASELVNDICKNNNYSMNNLLWKSTILVLLLLSINLSSRPDEFSVSTTLDMRSHLDTNGSHHLCKCGYWLDVQELWKLEFCEATPYTGLAKILVKHFAFNMQLWTSRIFGLAMKKVKLF